MEAVWGMDSQSYPHLDEAQRQKNLATSALQQQRQQMSGDEYGGQPQRSNRSPTKVQEFSQHQEFTVGPPPPPPPLSVPPRQPSRLSQLQKDNVFHIDTTDRGRDWDRDPRERQRSPVIIPTTPTDTYPTQPAPLIRATPPRSQYSEYIVSPPPSGGRTARDRDRERERDRARDRDRDRESSMSSSYSVLGPPTYASDYREEIIVAPSYSTPSTTSISQPYSHNGVNLNPQPAPKPLLRPMSSQVGMSRRRPGQ